MSIQTITAGKRGASAGVRLCLAMLVSLALATSVRGAGDNGAPGEGDPALNLWLTRQSGVKTWSAKVVQTRKLKSLVRPLESKGEVWFKQPNRFRWQLGSPPRTIAIRTEAELVVVYPRLKQAERYAMDEALDPSWKQVMALLDVGFPTDPEAFRAQYELVSSEEVEGVRRFELQPAARAARRLLDRIRLEVAVEDQTLLATELVFADGSTMRNRFSQHRFNVALDPGLFEAEIGEDFQVERPLERRK